MTVIFGFLVIISVAVILVGAIMMSLSKTRAKGQMVAGGGLLAFIAVTATGVAIDNHAAAKSGFESAGDKRQAESAGFTDPIQWAKHQGAIAKQRSEDAEKARIAAEKAEAEKEAACKLDISCIAERTMPEAITLCSPEIERLARNDFEWTGWSIGRFSRYRWKNKSKGIVTYIGDQIKFQNGFGAWIYHTYECDFDTNSRTPISVKARQGRLPAG